MAPRRLAVPPTEVAVLINEQAITFIEDKQRDLREALAERMDESDPAYPDAFVQSLSRLAAAVRTALHDHQAPVGANSARESRPCSYGSRASNG